MRIIPTRLHGLVNYLWGVSLIVLPFLLEIPGPAAWFLAGLGVFALIYSMSTDDEPGLVRLFPIRSHLVLDGILGLTLLTTLRLAGLPEHTRLPIYVLGGLALASSLTTKTRAEAPRQIQPKGTPDEGSLLARQE